jgi:hypothetical protein
MGGLPSPVGTDIADPQLSRWENEGGRVASLANSAVTSDGYTSGV